MWVGQDTPSYDIFRKACRLKDQWVFFSISSNLRLVYMTESKGLSGLCLSHMPFINQFLKVCAISLKLVSQLQRASVGKWPLNEGLSRIIDEMHFSYFPLWSRRCCIFLISLWFWQWQDLIFPWKPPKIFNMLILFSVVRKASFWWRVQSILL